MKNKLLKYARIFLRGLTGIGIELMYPLLVILLAISLCGIVYAAFIAKNGKPL